MVEDINKTHIFLTPKSRNSQNMTQYRPISLRNVLYKIIAKVLVNKLSTIMRDCIDEAQGAFITGRQISNNVLVAYEILLALKMKRSDKVIDMSRAYDRVEWDFLVGMMLHLGFHEN